MLGTYFYHEIIRKTIVGFGTLFNNVYIRHLNKDNSVADETKVGLSYGPSQKFLAKIQHDPTRKTGITQTFKTCDDGGNVKKVYMPVPYNITFELNIFSKLNDDALQIVEQILPFFQPSFNLTIDLVDSIGEKRDVPIVLDSIDFQDDYEGDFSTRRALIYTLRFTAKTYLFGPIADSTDGLIRKVQVDMYSGTNTQTAKREVRYTVTPKALEDKNNDGVINSIDDALLEPGDDFGFNEEWDFFQDSKQYSPTQQTDI